MKTKKNFVSVALSLALLINSSQVSADDVEIFDADSTNTAEVVDSDEDEDLGAVLIFNDPQKNNYEEIVNDNPASILEKPGTVVDEPYEVYNQPNEVVVFEQPANYDGERMLRQNRVEQQLKNNEKTQKQKKLKTLKPRFVKLTIDDTYTYYLDKQSISWKRIPYSASEYMLDVWVRLIENNNDTSDLPADMSEYINDTTNGEIEIARERGKAFAPVDVEVLQNKKYFLEHYYLRPKTKQIQFLCELEVVGSPQNTISEREYDYKNWENLIPGSIESIIYHATMKNVGKSGSSDKGHMSFADMLEEYARISIR